MSRIRGTHLLAASIVLWALAVWVFHTPHPAATETPPPAPIEGAQETGTAASGSAASAPAPAASGREAVVAAAPDTTAGVSSAPAASEHTDTGAAAAPSAGDRSSDAQAARAGSVAGGPITPGTSATGSAGGVPGGVESPRASAPVHPPSDSGPFHLPPPPGYPTMDDGAVAGQLNAARRAAWEGRFADAVAHYRAAARLRPNDHVVWGEMGNVLWTMRRWPEAAYALEGAATLLVRAGELRAASELAPAVARIDRQAAYRIERLLWEAAQRRPG